MRFASIFNNSSDLMPKIIDRPTTFYFAESIFAALAGKHIKLSLHLMDKILLSDLFGVLEYQ